jgi:hypothetical protein
LWEQRRQAAQAELTLLPQSRPKMHGVDNASLRQRPIRNREKDARHGQRDTAAAREAPVRCRVHAACESIEAVGVQGFLLNVASYVMRSV